MRRRFGRRRRGADEGRRALDPVRELGRVVEAGLIACDGLDPLPADEVPPTLAAVGAGQRSDGEALLVGVAPHSGADAWLAALAAAARRARTEGFAGEVIAVSAAWPAVARQRLALLGEVPFQVRALAEADAAGGAPVAAERARSARPRSVEDAARALSDGAARALFERAAAALAGLAAKHDGTLWLGPGEASLVLLGRQVARLDAEGRGLRIEVCAPRRESIPLPGPELADALDRLEGSLRKYLTDRKVRDGEPGTRAAWAARLAQHAGVRDTVRWPGGGGDPDPIDFVGVDGEGRVTLGVARAALTLEALGPVLDGVAALRPDLPAVLGRASAPVRFDAVRLLLAGERVDQAVELVRTCLALDVDVLEIGDSSFRTRPVPSLSAAAASPREAPVARAPEPAPAPAEPATPEESGDETAPRRFEEVSLFDLVEGEEGAGARRRRRSRRRGRGGRGRGAADAERSESGDDEASDDDESEPVAESVAESISEAEEAEPARAPGRRGRRRRRGRGRGRKPLMVESAEEGSDEDDEEEEDQIDRALEAMEADVPDFEELPEASYDDEEEGEPETESDGDRWRREREARRRARIAKTQPEPEPATGSSRPSRRRAALVAHADRESIGAAVLLAREVRLVEGIWVYPQSDLMTFFRGVTTDLREDTPIYVVGFTASPARDTLQAASLYRDRLTWFDHHDWPPEDLLGLREVIEAESVHVDDRAGSSLALVLGHCTRRSRFSDKLVDLLTGRFSRHDYERWGRLWWSRLGDIADQTGERRSALEPLLVGRPSDLAREAERAPEPPMPAELAYVSERDFRLIHFGGYVLVLVPTPAPLDVYLTARIARERYGAQLSLGWVEGEDRLVLAGEDGTSRRVLDFGALADHLAAKFDWVEALSDADHVARVRIAGLGEHPERLEEVVVEIAMGRSILEG
ncbi:MAG: hypothetical protein QNK03_00335 [Myxococcota bacterium]|nr:hypothetical protein [Myxococcota bacterium]